MIMMQIRLREGGREGGKIATKWATNWRNKCLLQDECKEPSGLLQPHILLHTKDRYSDLLLKTVVYGGNKTIMINKIK